MDSRGKRKFPRSALPSLLRFSIRVLSRRDESMAFVIRGGRSRANFIYLLPVVHVYRPNEFPRLKTFYALREFFLVRSLNVAKVVRSSRTAFFYTTDVIFVRESSSFPLASQISGIPRNLRDNLRARVMSYVLAHLARTDKICKKINLSRVSTLLSNSYIIPPSSKFIFAR